MELDYDIMLIDIDSPEMFNTFEMINAEKLYFITAFDNFSLRKGIEIIGKMIKEIEMTKILFERDFDETNNEYLNLLSLTSPIKWSNEIIYFPYDQGDLTAIIENQRASKIKFRNLSEQYRESLYIIAHEIIPETKSGVIKKIMKSL